MRAHSEIQLLTVDKTSKILVSIILDDSDHHGIEIIIREASAFDYSAMYVEQLLLVFHLHLGSTSPKRRYFCGVQSVSVSCTRTQTLDSTESDVG
jgi:hypothetical protein